jgi:hypothetical protein
MLFVALSTFTSRAIVGLASASNPTSTVSWQRSKNLKIYHATSSLVRSEKNLFLLCKCILLQHWRCNFKLRSRRIGSRSGGNRTNASELQRQRCKNLQRNK